MKSAHVICCNDAPAMVVIGSKEKAEELMEALEKQECRTEDMPIHGWLAGVDYDDPLYYYGSDADTMRDLVSEHPELGEKITYPGGFVKAGVGDCGVRFRAPLIGEHNEDILHNELKMSTEDMVNLKQRRVI